MKQYDVVAVGESLMDFVSVNGGSKGSILMEGNGDIALQIAALGDAQMAYDGASGLLVPQSGGSYKIASFYQNLVTELGSTVSSSEIQRSVWLVSAPCSVSVRW